MPISCNRPLHCANPVLDILESSMDTEQMSLASIGKKASKHTIAGMQAVLPA